jgi:hypothetical protein
MWYTATATETGFHLRFYDCCEFLISPDLSEVVVRSARTDRAGIIPVLIAGTLVAFILGLSGRTVLHASAVSVDGRAIAFIGPSGRGKTTVAALLCVEGGADLVTDDVLAVDPGPPAICIGGATELRLRATATPIVEARPEFSVRTTFDERSAFSPKRATVEPLSLGAIVIPGPSRTATTLVVERLPPGAAILRLLSAPRIHGWSDPGVLSRDFSTLSSVARQVPVYNATIPWGPPFDPSIAVLLADVGITGSVES